MIYIFFFLELIINSVAHSSQGSTTVQGYVLKAMNNYSVMPTNAVIVKLTNIDII